MLHRATANLFPLNGCSVPLLTPEDFFVEKLFVLSTVVCDHGSDVTDLTRVFHDCSVMNLQVIANRLEDFEIPTSAPSFRALPDDLRLALGHRKKCGRRKKGNRH